MVIIMSGLKEILDIIGPLDGKAMEEARKRQDTLTKPPGSLGRLEELSIKIAGITGKLNPDLRKKVIFTFAGDHGVVEEGVSAYPSDVTAQMVLNFINGGAGINVLARHAGARVVVADLGVDYDFGQMDGLVNGKVARGTKNFTKGPAMAKDEAVRAIESGIRIFEAEMEKGLDIIGTGDMGIGNTTSSSAISAVLCRQEVEIVTGRGTGIDDDGWKAKVKAIKKAIQVNNPDQDDPLDVLAKLGGFEIGGLIGVILAASAHRVPVMVDGFISTAAALIAGKMAPGAVEYMISAHRSYEVGHKFMLDELGLEPLLSLDMRLGEGTGAALGMTIVEAAVKILNEMATFQEAGVSGKE